MNNYKMTFEINYRKKNNDNLFNNLEDFLNVESIQNYIPIYNNFFELNETNYNNINLNNNFSINKIISVNEDNCNTFKTEVIDNENVKSKKNVFFKYGPLLDPFKYMAGKYDINDETLLKLPKHNSSNNFNKSNDVNNSSYVDGFFTYLTSKLLHHHNFVNGVDFYGSFLAIKKNFTYNVIDELDYLSETTFFNKHNNILFKIDNEYHNNLLNVDSRDNKKRININDQSDSIEILTLEDIATIDELDAFIVEKLNVDETKSAHHELCEVINISQCNQLLKECSIEDIDEVDNNPKEDEDDKREINSECSGCSSRTSNTTDTSHSECQDIVSNELECINDAVSIHSLELDDTDENNPEGCSVKNNIQNKSACSTNTGSNDDSNLTSQGDVVNAIINNFPVEIICLEKCNNTLDYLINETEMTKNDWTSVLMQIIMSLITYQKVFNFTHNDLHTNNIMFTETNDKFICYKYEGKFYQVPTYGKIFKIIDYGRAIYKFKGVLMCSDSFSKDGDAATQYNIEPYMIEDKPRLEPNYSFDLCRLACSIYDTLVPEEEHDDKLSNEEIETAEEERLAKENEEETEAEDDELEPIINLIEEWCKDDKSRNVLYKTNGGERYPDFKLYKMIARTVHNHTPQNQLKNPLFTQYITTKVKKSSIVINIDDIPSYC
jgi:hypothetical protein